MKPLHSLAGSDMDPTTRWLIAAGWQQHSPLQLQREQAYQRYHNTNHNQQPTHGAFSLEWGCFHNGCDYDVKKRSATPASHYKKAIDHPAVGKWRPGGGERFFTGARTGSSNSDDSHLDKITSKSWIDV